MINRNHIQMILLCAFVYALPYTLASAFYIDDADRSYSGLSNMALNGRPLADIVMMFVSFGNNVVDISPATYILSATTIFIATYIFMMKSGISGLTLVMSSTAACFSPFILQNFAYKFDSITMGLAISLVIFSSISFSIGRLLGVALASLMLVCSLSLYQPSINIYFALVAVLVLIDIYKHQACNINFIFDKFSALLISIIVYYFVIVPLSVTGGYAEKHGKVSTSILDTVINNVVNFYNIINSGLSGIHGKLISFFILAPIVILILIAVKITSSNKTITNKIFYILFSATCVLITYLSIGGLLLPLAQPIYAPRVLIGFSGVCVASCLIWSVVLGKKAKYIIGITAIAAISCVYAYGNALKSQAENDRFLLSMIAKDFIDMNKEARYMIVDRKPDIAPGVVAAARNFGIIKSITPSYVRFGWMFTNQMVAKLGVDLKYKFGKDHKEYINKLCSSAHNNNYLYSYGIVDDTYVLTFNKCK
ncbi:hypothetical protein FV310_08225 [Escherichia coli]|uniref:glucosyltransferase domain-containing protein n=1 Tax=Escherichia coli TaxID=562 RepID=UPI0011C83688|nr:glucosyltransferase domain-containing protein [Escherichia coli]TXR22684.1 hypothetical protein FV310_08225 [Escherichia coli]